MKEKLEIQIQQLDKALSRLEETLSMEPTQVNKDATIQRFEFTFELSWKLMKSFAFNKGLETVSPKDSLRTAAQLGLIEDVEMWFDFLDARNNSSHVYNENMASEVYEEIKKFLPAVKKLMVKIKASVI